jgi:hypothetical protein
MKAADLTGIKYGMLTALKRDGADARGKAQWLCACECGAHLTVLAQHLKSGNTRSCGAHGMGVGPAANQLPERYRIIAVDGPKLGMQPSSYGFCEVYDTESRELLFRNEPVSRLETPGEPSPNGARGMTWLQQQGLIDPKRNMTWRQWLIAARVTVEIRQSPARDAVDTAWEQAAGRPLREQSAPYQPTYGEPKLKIGDISPAAKFQLAAYLAEISGDADTGGTP